MNYIVAQISLEVWILLASKFWLLFDIGRWLRSWFGTAGVLLIFSLSTSESFTFFVCEGDLNSEQLWEFYYFDCFADARLYYWQEVSLVYVQMDLSREVYDTPTFGVLSAAIFRASLKNTFCFTLKAWISFSSFLYRHDLAQEGWSLLQLAQRGAASNVLLVCPIAAHRAQICLPEHDWTVWPNIWQL